MKEEHYFYAPDIAVDASLPADEASHALRVLRMKVGDELWAMDGVGCFYRCKIAETTKRDCYVEIVEQVVADKTWRGELTLAIAPTKMNERIEWLVEKAVEIGVDRIVLLNCQNSERNNINIARLQRIVVSAMKQSRKPFITHLTPLVSVADFLANYKGKVYIAHCRDDVGVPRSALYDSIDKGECDVAVLIGPEGDFSKNEVAEALKSGAIAVSLGNSRLRTETAGVVATHTMIMAREIVFSV